MTSQAGAVGRGPCWPGRGVLRVYLTLVSGCGSLGVEAWLEVRPSLSVGLLDPPASSASGSPACTCSEGPALVICQAVDKPCL